MFVLFALETYGASFARSDGFLVECASLSWRGCAGSGPSTTMLCTWFRHRVSTALQRSLAHAIHARFLCLEELMALLPPPLPRAPPSSPELHIFASLGWCDWLGRVESIYAHFCNKMGPLLYLGIQAHLF